MGGVVKGIGNAIGGIGGIASGVANAIPGIGSIAGPIVGGLTGGPMGFATSLASNALQGNYGGGGGGGSSSTPMYAQPNINYGNNTYQYLGKPLDVSPYFISGDKGVYNLLPALGKVNAGLDPSTYTQVNKSPFGALAGMGPLSFLRPQVAALNKANAYSPYEAYNDVLSKMAGDQKAIDAFKAAYNLPAPAPAGNSFIPKYNPHGQYVNYNLNKTITGQPKLTYGQLANYAAIKSNPFFMPYETTQGSTAYGFTPSASALAPINYSSYRQFLNDEKAKQLAATTPVTPAPVTPTPVTPTPVTPAPVTPTPVTPTPVTPPPPGNFTAMNRGGLASLRRR
jgi:hypothetical protein